MLFVADTHAFAWFLSEPEKLGHWAKKAFEDAEKGKNTIILPTICLAELYYLLEKKKSTQKFPQILEKLEKSANFTTAALDLETLKKTIEVKKIKELHDRIITATALLFEARLISKDSNIKKSQQVEIIW